MYIVHNVRHLRELQLTNTKIEANSSVIIHVLILFKHIVHEKHCILIVLVRSSPQC
jgi:hypothetical protein